MTSQRRCRSSSASSENVEFFELHVDPTAANPVGDRHNAVKLTRSGMEVGGLSNSSLFSWPRRRSTWFAAPQWSLYSSFLFGGSQEELGEPGAGQVREVGRGGEPAHRARLTRRLSSFELLPDQLDQLSVAETVDSEKKHRQQGVWCEFVGEDGANEVGLVEVVHAPIKTIARMREKLGECIALAPLRCQSKKNNAYK